MSAKVVVFGPGAYEQGVTVHVGRELIGRRGSGLDVDLILSGEVDASGSNVADLTGEVGEEGALDGEGVGLGVGQDLIGQEGRGSCALCDKALSRVRIRSEGRTRTSRQAAVSQEVWAVEIRRATGRRAVGIDGAGSSAANVLGGGELRRKGERSEIVEEDVVGDAEAGAYRGLRIWSPVDSDAWGKAGVCGLRSGEANQAGTEAVMFNCCSRSPTGTEVNSYRRPALMVMLGVTRQVSLP